MKKMKWMIGLVAIVSITSCTMTKKRYSSGYHIEWNNKKTYAEKQTENDTIQNSIERSRNNYKIEKIEPKSLEAYLSVLPQSINEYKLIENIKNSKLEDNPNKKKEVKTEDEVIKEKRKDTITTKREETQEKVFTKKEKKAFWSLIIFSLLGYLAYTSMLFGIFGFLYSFWNRKGEMKNLAKKGIWLFGIGITLKLISIAIFLWYFDGLFYFGDTIKTFIFLVFNR